MIVAQILKSKPEGPIITISPGATVGEAAKLLSDNRIGAVVVSTDGERAEGILSERDIVREIGRKGAGCLSEAVTELMTSEIVGCELNTTIDKIMGAMTGGRFRHMPVLTDGKMVGVISIGDVVKARMEELAHESEALQDMIMGR